ncbi:hypothetical protein GGI20_001918 [Coemansia sp. BCRC 34301]|nr:hypothetical protein GGI20_001918 [Coemansia sp. BCRC 34301]
MSVTEYLQQLDSVIAVSIRRYIGTMATARNALALSTVCVFVVASLALWKQPRRTGLLKRTVGHVLEAGFGTGDGHSGKPLLPRFIRRLFHSHLPQFTLYSDRNSGSAAEKADSEVVYHQQHLDTVPENTLLAQHPPPPLLPPLRPSLSGAENEKWEVDGPTQHVGGGAKRRHRRHRGKMDGGVSAVKHRQRLKHRARLAKLPLPATASVVVAAKETADEQVGEKQELAGRADDDPVVDVTQPRQYRPAPIGQRSATAATMAEEGRRKDDDTANWTGTLQSSAAEFSLFSSDFF